MVVRVDEQGRAVGEGPQVQVGGNERYVSVSRAEFKKNLSRRITDSAPTTDAPARRLMPHTADRNPGR